MLGRVLFLHVVIFSGVICGFAPPDRIIKVLQSFPTPKKRTVHMATVTLCDFFFLHFKGVAGASVSPLNQSEPQGTSESVLRLQRVAAPSCINWHMFKEAFSATVTPLSHENTQISTFLSAGDLCVCVGGLLHQHSISQRVLWQVLLRFSSHDPACFHQRFSLTPAAQTDSRYTKFCCSSERIPTATMRDQ